MTIVDGDIFAGWLRERVLLRKLVEEYLLHRSPLVKNYVDGIVRATGLDREVVLRSKPVKNLINKIIGGQPPP